MQNQDYENRLQDNQEALSSLNERMNDLVKREKEREELQKQQQLEQQKREELIIEPGNRDGQTAVSLAETKVPDYSAELLEIKQVVQEIAASATPLKQAEELTTIVERVLNKLPGTISTVTLHRFDAKAKTWIACAYGILLLASVLSAIIFVQWRENGKLQANDVKFRLMRHYYPMAAFWADTAYRHRPEKMALLAEKLEAMSTDSSGLKAGNMTEANHKSTLINPRKTKHSKHN